MIFRSPRQTDSIELSISYEKSFKLCIITINNLGFEIIKKDFPNGLIEAISGISIRSWGEKLTFQITKINQSNSIIQIKSSPKVLTTLFDFGKSKENILRIKNELISNLSNLN